MIKDIKYIISLLISLTRKGKLKPYKFKNNHGGVVSILANGPSLKLANEGILKGHKDFTDVDEYIVMNYYPNSEVFWKIKPKVICFADPMFYMKSSRESEAKELYSKMQSIDWQMNVYIPAQFENEFREFSKLYENKNLNIIGINTFNYAGRIGKHWFYKNGYATPSVETVAILAIYTAIMSGYKEIRLYGVDHTFFDSMYIDQQNRLCQRYKHFYSDEEIIKPMVDIITGENLRISQHLEECSRLFRAHEVINAFAKYMGVKIYNYTQGSMIDEYERKQ